MEEIYRPADPSAHAWHNMRGNRFGPVPENLTFRTLNLDFPFVDYPADFTF